MAARVDDITIVGGGMAGWLAAVMLDHFLNSGTDAPVTITVVESPDAPPPVAGEATLPSLPRLIQQLGFDEHAFMRRCNATFKLGVRHTGWQHDAEGRPRGYVVPHTDVPRIRGRHPGLYHMAFDGGGPGFIDAALPASGMIGQGLAPRALQDGPFGARAGYAYHLDAEAFTHILWERAVEGGVRHVLDDIDRVELDDAGNVAALALTGGERKPVQLVLDATGRIVHDALDVPVAPDPTPNDRVLAVRAPEPERGLGPPITETATLSVGWAWRLPLAGRVSAGYVYSAAHLGDDAARTELLDHLGVTGDAVTSRIVPVRFGRTRRSWVANCVAVGAAAGLHEPLDSTAIAAVERAVRWLQHYWPDRGANDALRVRYNTIMGELEQEIADFAATHYRLATRADTAYWREAAADVAVSDSHLDNLDLWTQVLPGDDDLTHNTLFLAPSYTAVLFGTGFYAGREVPKSADLPRDDWTQFRRKVDNAKAQMRRNLPTHAAAIAAIRGAGGRRVAGLPGAGTQPAML